MLVFKIFCDAKIKFSNICHSLALSLILIRGRSLRPIGNRMNHRRYAWAPACLHSATLFPGDTTC